MLRSLTTFLLVSITTLSFSQGLYKFPTLAAKAAKLEGFLPRGWHVLDQAAGDLNKDNLPDIAAVIEGDAEVKNLKETDNTAKPRILVLAFQQTDGSYVLSAQSNGFIMLSNEGGVFGDPWSGIKVERGSVLISFYGGSSDRWGFDYRFRYQNNDWFLIGATYLTHSTLNGDGESYDFNLLTGAMEHKEGKSIDDGAKPDKITKLNIGKKPLRSLKQFASAGQWNIYKDVYL
ncbi:MAG: hypothetical protein U0Y10_06925 [Spirosomataceae bacterium]